jgi:IS5 family transposase
MRWDVPSELTAEEAGVAKYLHRVGKFYVFLREVRGELFDEGFEQELERAYGKARGTAPLPPALLATVMLLQAYDQVSDAEAVVTARMDKRWQLVLGCLGETDAPFSQGVLVDFRERMVAHDLDRKLLDRTVELAKKTGKFGWQHLKVALDSSPLLGAGRVLDTWNLIGKALSTVVDCAAKTLGRPREQILDEADLSLLRGPSIKAALDIDWDDSTQKDEALQRLLAEVDRLEAWVKQHAGDRADKPPLREALVALRRVLEQDLEPDPTDGRKKIRRGVARDRMPSLGDREMRHGRKSKSRPFTGYKRHIARAAGTGVIVGAVVLPANQPEHEAVDALLDDSHRHGGTNELHIDRGYLASPRVEQARAAGVVVRCKPWPSRNQGRFTKEDFTIDLARRRVTCPAGIVAQFKLGSSEVRFPAEDCQRCEVRSRCTVAHGGRTVGLHPQEELLLELRATRKTSEGRRALRERVAVEHSLARIGQLQGVRARYKGIRKNTLDLRRCAAVANLQDLARIRAAA